MDINVDFSDELSHYSLATTAAYSFQKQVLPEHRYRSNRKFLMIRLKRLIIKDIASDFPIINEVMTQELEVWMRITILNLSARFQNQSINPI